ncbi:MAG: hypothetical protein VCA38_06280 [Roseibacillus sp.]|jgi:hypothetical protein
MIKRILAIAAVAFAGLLTAPNAEAGHTVETSITYRSGYASCGCPIYTRRFVRSYDHHGHPIYGYSHVPFPHGSSCRLRTVHGHHPHLNHAPVYHHTSSHHYAPRIVISSRSRGHHGHHSSFSFGIFRR